MEEMAYAYWRLAKWVENADVEHKMAANSALRQIKRYLDENGIEIIDNYGQKFDSGFAIDVLGRKSGEELQEEELVIVETVKPVILKEKEVVKYGQVFLGVDSDTESYEEKPLTIGKYKAIIRHIDSYCDNAKANKITAWLLKRCKSRLKNELDHLKESK